MEYKDLRMGLPVWAKEGGGWTKATVVLVSPATIGDCGQFGKADDPRGLKVKVALHRAGRNQSSGFKYLDQLAPRDKEKKGEDHPNKGA